jgi:hypothetical protein
MVQFSEMFPTQELARRLYDAWTNYRNWSQPGWPDVQIEDTEWPDIDRGIMIEQQGIIITGGTNPAMRQKEEGIIHECKQRMHYVRNGIRKLVDTLRVNKADDDVYKDYVNGNISGVFRRVFPKKDMLLERQHLTNTCI